MFMLYPDIIVLAGGLGTRLRGVVNDLPKAMAPVIGKPFLEYILDFIAKAGFQRVILSTGYMSKSIEDYFHDSYRSLEIVYSVEKEPLGTGGAIKLASKKVTTPYFIVMNGDTLFRIDMQQFFTKHVEQLANVSIALRRVEDASRYGLVECDDHCNIISFHEKSSDCNPGLINGGIYIIKTKYFKKLPFPNKFSLESEWMQKNVGNGEIQGQVFNDYFLDIGIPEDYERAQTEFDAFKDR